MGRDGLLRRRSAAGVDRVSKANGASGRGQTRWLLFSAKAAIRVGVRKYAPRVGAAEVKRWAGEWGRRGRSGDQGLVWRLSASGVSRRASTKAVVTTARMTAGENTEVKLLSGRHRRTGTAGAGADLRCASTTIIRTGDSGMWELRLCSDGGPQWSWA
ncbi:uncharacterized protein A4U43_C01F19620 [Asparagus officinalis]|uniref:Uncharacterized protein n=1 Tax=Asparagus officinalis TaxID=4686 RepID=A0A5P1FUC8_ASPOF|nr:uncharacterized protein A4U43_C01F19620 [Asparagus officinalis]